MVADRRAGLRDQFCLAGILAELNTGGLIPHEKVMRSMQLVCEERALSGVTGASETLTIPGMLQKSPAFVPRYYKFESIPLQRRVRTNSVGSLH